MLPLKQPPSPVMLGTVSQHLATFKAYSPAVPMQEARLLIDMPSGFSHEQGVRQTPAASRMSEI